GSIGILGAPDDLPTPSALINTAWTACVDDSAGTRLLIPAGEFKVVRTDQAALDGIPVGGSIGILGAPDDLPTPSALINTAWTACVDDSAGT
ncbi:hypothetical protein CTI14_64130, partial [Methylobacterium radiotolerans]